MKRRSFLRSMLTSPRGAVGALVIVIAIVATLAAPYMSLPRPETQDLRTRLKPPVWSEAGSMEHPLGTDHLGRDLLSRIVFGARVSLTVSLTAVVLAIVVGVGLGVASGFLGGRFNYAIMRLVDIQLSFPVLLLAIILVATLRPSIQTVILVLVINGWATYARVVRAQVLSLREREFVQAAQAMGASRARIMAKHVLPNVSSIVIVLGTVQTAQFILAESSLSFLGLGIMPPTPSWGGMINEGRGYIWSAWWIQTFPGIAIVAVVSGIGLFGDWLRDHLDPRKVRV